MAASQCSAEERRYEESRHVGRRLMMKGPHAVSLFACFFFIFEGLSATKE